MIHLCTMIAIFKLGTLFLCVLPHLIYFQCLSCQLMVTIIPSRRNCQNSALCQGNVKQQKRLESHENEFRFCYLMINLPSLKSIGFGDAGDVFIRHRIDSKSGYITNQLACPPGTRLPSFLLCVTPQFFSSPWLRRKCSDFKVQSLSGFRAGSAISYSAYVFPDKWVNSLFHQWYLPTALLNAVVCTAISCYSRCSENVCMCLCEW